MQTRLKNKRTWKEGKQGIWLKEQHSSKKWKEFKSRWKLRDKDKKKKEKNQIEEIS